MDNNCDICGLLGNLAHQLLTTEHWNVGLGNNHAYLGRAFVTLRTHKSSLSELDDEEWEEFKDIVKKLERTYKDAFGAEPLNWACLMNNAYRVEPAHPHVHWHIFPRYRKAPELDGIVFDDPLFGEMYDSSSEKLVNDEVVDQIIAKLKDHLS